jgi:Zn finger protein HypA/HybF involved in hydrogenase expression
MIDELWLGIPAECLDCGKEWVAVFPLGAGDLECPQCGSDNTVRFYDGLEGDE